MMTKFSKFGEKFKEMLERVLRVAVLDSKVYTDVIHISCIFIGMLVAKCVKAHERDHILDKICGWIREYEDEHRQNMDDLRTMVRNKRKPGP